MRSITPALNRPRPLSNRASMLLSSRRGSLARKTLGGKGEMDQKLPDDAGVLVATYGATEFRQDIVKRFAMLSQDLHNEPVGFHLDVGAIAGVVRSELQAGNIKLSHVICEFLSEILRHPNADPELLNAIATSFIEPTELRETELGHQLLQSMPQNVRDLLIE